MHTCRKDTSNQTTEKGSAETKKETSNSLGDSASRVIDWNGPEKEGSPPPEWSKGWGGFPGAKYLGIRPKNEKVSEQQSNPLQEGDEKPAVKELGDPGVAPAPHTFGPEGKPTIQEQPASAQPGTSTEK